MYWFKFSVIRVFRVSGKSVNVTNAQVEWEIAMYNFPKITEPGRGLFWSATEHFHTSDEPRPTGEG